MSDKAIGEVFSENLRARRENLGLTQIELARQLNQTAQMHAAHDGSETPSNPITNRSVYQWEHGHVPRAQSMKLLCEVLQVSQDYLFGRDESDIIPVTKSETLHSLQNEDELLLYDEEPLYFLPNDDITKGYWVIVDVYHHTLVSPMHTLVSFQDVDFRKSSLYTKYPFPKVMPRSEAKEADEVFIYPIRFKRKNRINLQGWCKYNKDERAFVKTDLSFLFPENQYGQTYLAFAEIPSVIV